MLLGQQPTGSSDPLTKGSQVMKTIDILPVFDPDDEPQLRFDTAEGIYESSVEDCWGYCFCCGELRHDSCCDADTTWQECEC